MTPLRRRLARRAWRRWRLDIMLGLLLLAGASLMMAYAGSEFAHEILAAQLTWKAR